MDRKERGCFIFASGKRLNAGVCVFAGREVSAVFEQRFRSRGGVRLLERFTQKQERPERDPPLFPPL